MSLLGGIVGGVLGLIGGERRNSAQSAESAESREWQERMRDTTHQSAVKDLQAAGLNPMLAYGGGNQTPAAPNVPQLENTAKSAMESAAVAAQLKQVDAQTELLEAQARKVEAEIPQVTTSTANIAQQTENLKRALPKIDAEIAEILESKQLKYQQGLSEVDRRNLMEAQRKLAQIDYELRAEQITNTQALTATQKVLTQLRAYEIPGAKNIADFEETLSGAAQYGGAAGKAATTLGTVLNSARKVMGK